MGYHRTGYPERVLALDIETVPDRGRLPTDWAGKLPRPTFHQAVCIALGEAEIEIDGDEYERYRLIACRSGGKIDWDEARLLTAFWAYFAKCPTRLVGWNTRGFDVRVLLQRLLARSCMVFRLRSGSMRALASTGTATATATRGTPI